MRILKLIVFVSASLIALESYAMRAPVKPGGPPAPWFPREADRGLECENLLKSTEQLNYDDPILIRAQVGMAVLAMIFEHPVFLAANADAQVSDKDRLKLFHLSGGFLFPPEKNTKFANAFGMDRTGFWGMVSEGKYRSGKPTALQRIPYTEFEHFFGRTKNDRFRQFHKDWREVSFYTLVFEAVAAQWDGLRWSQPTEENASQKIKVSIDHNLFLEGMPQASPSKLRVKTSFRAFDDQALRELRNLGDALRPPLPNNDAFVDSVTLHQAVQFADRHTLIKSLGTELLIEHFAKIVEIRDQILQSIFENGTNVRDALRSPSGLRQQVRDEILAWINQDPSLPAPAKVAALPAPAKSAESTESFTAPSLTPVKKWDVSGLDDLLSDWQQPASDPLLLPRKASQLIDGILGTSARSTADLGILAGKIEGLLTETELPKIMAYLNELAQQNDEELDNIEVLQTRLQTVLEKTNADLSRLSQILSDSSLSAARRASKIQEAELLELSLSQTMISLTSTHTRKVEWASILVQLQALLRTYRDQKFMGEDVGTLASQITSTVNTLAGKSSPQQKAQLLP